MFQKKRESGVHNIGMKPKNRNPSAIIGMVDSKTSYEKWIVIGIWNLRYIERQSRNSWPSKISTKNVISQLTGF